MEQKRVVPWHTMFRYAVHVCRVSPKDFWDMTIKEFIYLADCPESNSLISSDLVSLSGTLFASGHSH